MLYDRERDDGTFSPKDPTSHASSAPSDGSSGSSHDDWNPLDSILVTMPPWHPVVIASAMSNGKADKEKDKDKIPKNPVSHWRVSKKKIVGQ